MKKTVLVLGKSGRLARVLAELNSDYIFLSRTACDVTNEESVRSAIADYNPAVVINCAAQTDMDACERDPEMCRALNTTAVRFIADACHEHKAYCIHVSTDFAAEPVNAYGHSKRDAEPFAAAAGVAIRVNFYTSESFVPKNLIAGKPITAYTNIYFNPVSVYSFASFLIDCTQRYLASGEKPYSGVIGFGVTEKLSVYDFSLAVCKAFGKDASLVSKGHYDGSGLPRKLDTYINSVYPLSVEEDLKVFHDSITQ